MLCSCSHSILLCIQVYMFDSKPTMLNIGREKKIVSIDSKRMCNRINHCDERVFIYSFCGFFFHSIFSYNLYELIKKNNYQGFSLSLIRRFCNSIIKCLRLLYQENIIHCDLKPVCMPLQPKENEELRNSTKST